MSLIGTLGEFGSGGADSNEDTSQAAALAALQGVAVPTVQQLDLPTLEQYAAAYQMTPAQMQAFLQQNNALASENVDQTGTAAQQQALAELANVSNEGAAGDATEQAQQSQIQNAANEQIGGQVGAINQAAEARGVPVGLLQAALSQQAAGQGVQSANQAALTAQSGNYQTALNALANQGTVGANLQGQQNTQANTVAAAQNAMQQFNAANQQQASGSNANFTQAANAANTQANNLVQTANTGLKNQQTEYNAAVPQTEFQDQLNKATGVAQQNQNNSANQQAQGNQNMQIAGGVTGLGLSTVEGGNSFGGGGSPGYNGGAAGSGGSTEAAMGGGDADLGSMADTAFAHGGVAGYSGGNDGYANGGAIGGLLAALLMSKGGIVPKMCDGGMAGRMNAKDGMVVPGKAKVPGDSKKNDTVPVTVSPGEAVIPRTVVQQNPADVMRLLAAGSNPQGMSNQNRPTMPMTKPGIPQQMPGQPMPHPMPQQPQPGHDPKDIAALLQAMKHLRGAH